MEKTVKRKTTDGLIWNSMQKFASKGLQLLFSILIARILLPEDYGLIAIANLFISLSDVLIDSGFSKALIRKQDKSESDYATVFWFNLGISVVIYTLLYFSAPLIGDYYDSVLLVSVIRVILLTLIINALCGIQSLRLVIEMNFRKLAILETIAMAIGGVVALYLATKGAKVWALVAQTLVGATARTLLIWGFSKWQPVFKFSWETAKNFFSFGSKLLLSDFLGRIYGAIFTMTIGKKFSTDQLGLYGKADAIASAPSSFIMGPIGSVTFPALSEIQSEEERMRQSYLSMVKLTSVIVCPVFLGLIAIAPVLVPVLLTETWNAMIPYLQILCVSCLFFSFTVLPQNSLLILGKSRSILSIQVITRIIGIILLYPISRISLLAVCIEMVFISFITWLLSLFYLQKAAEYSIVDYLKSIAPSLILSIFMMSVVALEVKYVNAPMLALVFGIVIGTLFYALSSMLFNREQAETLLLLTKPYLRRK